MNTTFGLTATKESLRELAFDLPRRFSISRWAPIPLRLIVGYGFMEHSFAKLSRGPEAFADGCGPPRRDGNRASTLWV